MTSIFGTIGAAAALVLTAIVASAIETAPIAEPAIRLAFGQ